MFVKKDICRRHQFLSLYTFWVVELINKYSKYTEGKAHCLTEEDGTK